MKILQLSEQFHTNTPTTVTIGNFDGLHLGHQSLINATVSAAKKGNGNAALITFDPHPQEVLHGKQIPKICTSALNLRLLEQSGLDVVHFIPFTSELSCISPEEFAYRFLIQPFQLHTLVIGYDFRFGKNRSGDFKLLENLSLQYGFTLKEVPPFQVNGQTVSSTLIRQLIQAGKFAKIPAYLGRPYTILGEVILGNQRGRTLGVPTANLCQNICLPLQDGVYVVRIDLGQGTFYGVSNIGHRPTFDEMTTVVETHLFDFNDNLYGQEIEIYPLHFIRPIQSFASVELLVQQIHQDIANAHQFLRN